MDGETCIVCRERLLSGNDTVDQVREKGLQTVKACSIKKGDGLDKLLDGVKNIRIHSKCRKQYTKKRAREDDINSEKSSSKKTFTQSSSESIHQLCVADIDNQPSTSSSSLPDHQADVCFFCNTRITNYYIHNELKKPLHKRNVVFTVREKCTKISVMKAALTRNDELGTDVLGRIENIDLVQTKARYHKNCYKNFFSKKNTDSTIIGRPKTNEVSNSMEAIFSYIENHQSNCQFSLKELKDVLTDKFVPHDKTLKDELKKIYGDNILITNLHGRTPIITFKDDLDNIIFESWSHNKQSAEEENILTVLKAAQIIRKDIRSRPYETEFYSSPNSFLENAEKDVPDSLLNFLGEVINSNKYENECLKTKILAIAHAIITATRPRSFISSIFIALSTFLNKNFGSKKLISALASLGFCTSYYQSTEFDASCASHTSLFEKNMFVQYVFDNADANICTLDGMNTFHAMGGIEVLTPGRTVMEDNPIFKINSVNVASDSCLGVIPLKQYNLSNKVTITEKYQDLRQTNSIKAFNSELVWAIGRFQELPELRGWNGFMHEITKEKPYEKSEIVPLPFINASASEKSTIYTAIQEALNRLPKGQKSCIVTFDQPLFIKAREIVLESGLQASNNIVVRLGGFHLLMSFMGSIGFIMAGSGLQDLWKIIYASASTEQMMTGHAYSRALRAHLLTQEALYQIIFSQMNMPSETVSAVADFFIESGSLETLQEDLKLTELCTQAIRQLHSLRENGPTAKLWVQYVELVTLIRQFIEAERTGNWKLHIDTIAKMMPFFGAAGHYNYAKSAQLYLQDMLNLKEVMTEEEYDKFTVKGYFTIRRSDRYWSGLWSDLTIEQTLMRNIKSPGGLTSGRGMTENVLAKWISAMPVANKVIESFSAFTNNTEDQSELSTVNADSSKSRIVRDAKDLKKLVGWFNEHPPFQENYRIMSISTGVVGDTDKINCYKAELIGSNIIEKNVDKEFRDVKFQRKDRVVPLASLNSAIKIQNVDVPIEPLTLFQRISYAKKDQQDLQNFLTYELAPYPLSLFDEKGIRKGKKSSLYEIYLPVENPDSELGRKRYYVVDGGHLLHKVVWNKGDIVNEICQKYTTYIKNNYGTEATVVFDGYSNEHQSTKTFERTRRAKHVSKEIIFDPTMAITTTKELFLENSRNKERLVSYLEGYFNEEGIEFRQAQEDADWLIVETAFEKATDGTQPSVVIVGEDIDLLVIMTEKYNSTQAKNVYFLKPSKGNIKQKLYGCNSLQNEIIKEHILVLHAISGCDTTSALFMQGKKKFINTLSKNSDLIEELKIFKRPDANVEHMQKAGQTFLVMLYGGKNISLNSLRYKMFTNLLLKTKSNLASLPPTEAAANQHILRTYLQVQRWLGNAALMPTNFGWKTSSEGLVAYQTSLDPAPQELLNFISCKCKTGCERMNCSCRKAGLKCSIICGVCSGQSCTNTENIQLQDDIDFDPAVD